MNNTRADNEILRSINNEYYSKASIKKQNTIDLLTLNIVIWYIVLIEVVYYASK